MGAETHSAEDLWTSFYQRMTNADPSGTGMNAAQAVEQIEGRLLRSKTAFWDALTESPELAKLAGRAPGYGTMLGAARKGLTSFGRGALSAIAPINIISDKEIRAKVSSSKVAIWTGKILGPGLSRALGKVATVGGKWLGPLWVGYRMYDEGILHTPRIVAEEALITGFFATGMWAGAGIGAAVGTATFPVVGTIVGAAAGIAIGFGLSMLAKPIVDKMAYLATGGAVTRGIYAAGKFVHDLGQRNKRLELGGKISLGNSTNYAATMRMRALNQMNYSGNSALSMLGKEAQLCSFR